MSELEPGWLRHLKKLGQAQGFLTYAQLNESLPLAMVDPMDIESTVEQLKQLGIRVVPDSPVAGD
jgi:RNA polymerase primary sigma factor